MRRTDHSMRPPMPAATIAFKSPNACDSCHKDKAKDAAAVAAWSDQWVRKWRKRDYQAATLRWAGLIDAAHKGQWARLAEMCGELTKKDRQEVVAASLARLLRACDDPRRLPALLAGRQGRFAAGAGGGGRGARHGRGARASPRPWPPPARTTIGSSACRAAAALAGYPPAALADANPLEIQIATDEYLASLRAGRTIGVRTSISGITIWPSAIRRRRPRAFETAVELEPDVLMPYLNASIAYAQLNRKDDAEKALRRR